MSAEYSMDDVCRLANLNSSQLRAFVRAGVLSSKDTKQNGFDFGDLVLLRTAGRLLSDGVPLRQLQVALKQLAATEGAPRPVSGVRLSKDGSRLVAEKEGLRWEPQSGQACFRFDAKEVELSVVDARAEADASGMPEQADLEIDGSEELEDAEALFEFAMGCENEEPEAALLAYLKALAANPEHFDAGINAGRLLAMTGERERAAAFFRVALRLEPEHPVAYYNLAVTHHDAGELNEAAIFYRQAIEYDAEFADAHFNLAALLEQRGDRRGALFHLDAYHRVTDEEWAE